MFQRTRPFGEEPEKWLDYEVIETAKFPEMSISLLKSIGNTSLIIDVDHQNIYTTRELTGLALVGLGHQHGEMPQFRYSERRTGKNHPSYGMYMPLGVTPGGRGHGRRVQAHAVGLSFRTGVFRSDPVAELKEKYVLAPISDSEALTTSFFAFTPLMAEGLDNEAIADIHDCSLDVVYHDLTLLMRYLDTTRAGLVMFAGALGVLDRPNPT